MTPREKLKEAFKEFMLSENLDFISVDASLSVNKRNVYLAIIEEYDDDDDNDGGIYEICEN